MLLYLLAVIIDEPALTVPPPLPASAQAAPHFYLKPPAAVCDKSRDPGEIVVCGNQDADKRYRLQPIDPQQYADAPIRAETNVAGGVLGTTVQQVGVGGFVSNRVMLNFKIKF